MLEKQPGYERCENCYVAYCEIYDKDLTNPEDVKLACAAVKKAYLSGYSHGQADIRDEAIRHLAKTSACNW